MVARPEGILRKRVSINVLAVLNPNTRDLPGFFGPRVT